MSANTTMAAADALRKAVSEAMKSLPSAIQAIRDANAKSNWGSDIIEEMQSTIALIVALDDATDALSSAHTGVRRALATSMDDTGAPAIQSEHHTASLKDAPRSVVITGEVPASMTKPPEPQKPRPDMDAIKAALKSGPLSYAHISNGGPQGLQIRTRTK